ncbi:MAG: DoxX family protein [Segetibacter sp.]|nr:DoxX family protein [Segetibacter sp.]
MKSLFGYLNNDPGIGIFILRLFTGVRLIYGVIDNVLNWDRMIEFKDFLEQFHFPLPLISAIVSVYAQLFAGISYLLGWQIRYAAILMIINFTIAVLMVHWGQTFDQMTSPLSMLFISVLLLFQGAGKYSLDRKRP